MPEAQSWRSVLGSLIRDSSQKQKISSELGVDPLTLTRWVEKKSNPRLAKLRRLLKILPEQRALLLPSIVQEFPDIADGSGEEILPEEIPSAIYKQVLSRISTFPNNQGVWSLCDLILHQAFEQLDPQHRGVCVFLTQCVRPTAGNKVRSLRSTMGVGITPWGGNVEHQTILMGSETVPGRVVSSRHPLIIENFRDQREGVHESRIGIASSCTYPLLREDRLLGTFGAICNLPGYFLPPRQALIQRYATLVSAIFPSDAFYAPQDIQIGVMPRPEVQLPYLNTFRARVQRVLVEAVERKEPLSGVEAEQLVWQQLEEELLHLTLPKK